MFSAGQNEKRETMEQKCVLREKAIGKAKEFLVQGVDVDVTAFALAETFEKEKPEPLGG